MTYSNGSPQYQAVSSETEVKPPVAPATRRRFTRLYKRQVVAKLETMTPSERGAFLRKEGVYSSIVSKWRRQLGEPIDASDKGAVEGEDRKNDSLELRALKRRLEQVELKLHKAQVIIDFQKKSLGVARHAGGEPVLSCLIAVVKERPTEISLLRACESLSLNRNHIYRSIQLKPERLDVPVTSHPNSLTTEERAKVLEYLRSERFVDSCPHTVYNRLLDEQVRICSVSTMYRILRAHGEQTERRTRGGRRNFARPQLEATRPNQVWSWDITLLKGPVRGVFYYLYVILDIFSRRVVGWTLANREDQQIAKELIYQSCKNASIALGQLTLHSDRGAAMKSLTVAGLCKWMGVEQSFGRPRVSNDNPFSEAYFATFKTCPAFPGSFESFEEARAFCCGFFNHYNDHHYHSGICFLTPNTVHFGNAEQVLAERYRVEKEAYEANPRRFPAGPPRRRRLPWRVAINSPERTTNSAELTSGA